MIETEVPKLDPDIWYEECPDCPADGEGYCITCWDEGLVPHGHLAGVEVAADGGWG